MINNNTVTAKQVIFWTKLLFPLQSYMSMFGEKDEQKLCPAFSVHIVVVCVLRVPGEKGRLIGIEPLKEYVQIGESQFLIEPGNLSES